MATLRFVGNDGGITLPSGTHDAIIRRWSAQFPRVISRVTGFTDTLSHNILGVMNITGSASGTPSGNNTTTSLGIADRVAIGSALTLTVGTGCSFAFTAAFQNISVDSDKEGDAGVSFDFENGDSNTFTETWDETP